MEDALSGEIRIVSVIPGDPNDEKSMPFVKRQIQDLENSGVINQSYFIKSRMSPVGLVKDYFALKKLCKEFQPSLVHAHYGTVTSFLVSLLPNILKVVSFRGSDINLNKVTLRKLITRTLSIVSSKRFDQIICVTQKIAEQLPKVSGEVTIIPSGVNTKKFKPMGYNESRNDLGIEKNVKVVVFNAGRSFSTVKRVDLALQVIKKLKTTVPGLKEIILKADIEPEDMPRYLNAADCLIVTSDAEGSPNIVKEAIACGLPVVTFDVGDVVEILKGTASSKVLTNRDIELMSSEVRKILESGNREVPTSDFLSKYSSDESSSKIKSCYEKLLSHNSKASSLHKVLE